MSKQDIKFEQAVDKIKLAKEYTMADNIIRYLTNPNDDSIVLSEQEKKRYDVLKEVHGYRMRFQRKSDIVNILVKTKGLSEGRCYALVQESEHVFGSLDGVNKAYERNFLLECSRKNIELAFATRKSEVISKALKEHYMICGLNEAIVEMPDFSALEPNNYTISLPENQQAVLMAMLAKGYVNMKDLVPHQNITFDVSHKDVTNDDSE